MEKYHFPWEKRFGLKRIPFIIIGGILWLISYLVIFLVPLNWDPVKDQWLIFAWYLISLCIYDTVGTLYDVNVLSIYPIKFQGLKERRTVQGFGTILGIIGLVLAAIIPPMFITTGKAVTYRNSALVTLVLGLLMFVVILPGVWENRTLKERYKLQKTQLKEADSESFLKSGKRVVTDRRFMAKVIFFYGYQTGAVMLQTSAFYITTYLVDAPASTVSLLLGAMLLGALISVPIWTMMSNRVNNNKKMSLIAGWTMFVMFIPMIFVNGIIAWAICLLLFGISLGGQWFIDQPTMGDVLDDVAVRTGKRQTSLYYGYQAFFVRLGMVTIALTIAITHILTGFVEGAPSLAELMIESPTPELALFGIRIHSAIVPAIIVLVSILIFWKYYDLTPEKVVLNKAKLKELKL